MTTEVKNNQKTSGNLKYRVINVIQILFLCFITLTACDDGDGGGGGSSPNSVNITKLDFELVNGAWTVEWPGTSNSRHNLRYTEVTHFRPIIRVNPAPNKEMKVAFWVWHRTSFPDTDHDNMGTFDAFWHAGETEPYRIVHKNQNMPTTLPVGAPNETIGTFWLGCTKKGLIRGNWARQGQGPVYVYLMLTDLQAANQPSVINVNIVGQEHLVQRVE